MRRGILAVGVVAGAFVLGGAGRSAAGPISTYNPYRSFNISGINYGSMQWERTHRSSSGWHRAAAPRGRFFFRRR
jgi:hypothetical protein